MINTKLIMSSCSILMGLNGVLLIFLPQEILAYLGQEITLITILFVQLIGALYFGFGYLNWMSRSAILGGIYGKPLIVGNASHFIIVAFTLVKTIFKLEKFEIIFGIITLIYVFYALMFGMIMRTNPKMKAE